MSDLPDTFTLTVERKPDGHWVVRRPEHPGLCVAHRRLPIALEDVPLALALLLRLNGPTDP